MPMVGRPSKTASEKPSLFVHERWAKPSRSFRPNQLRLRSCCAVIGASWLGGTIPRRRGRGGAAPGPRGPGPRLAPRRPRAARRRADCRLRATGRARLGGDMRLRGKVAVVTGGGSGIGRGIVLAMAREGADLAIPDIQVVNAEKVAQEVQALGRKAFALKTDVTSATDVKAMIDRTRETLGRIDIVVNNAGIAAPPGMPFTNNTEEDWDRVYAVNVKSVFLVCKAVAPHFIERKGGRIINIASIAGPIAALTMPPYPVSKMSVIVFTRIVAKELAPHGVTVNAICPGVLWTSFWEGLAAHLAKTNPAFAGMTARQGFDQRVT